MSKPSVLWQTFQAVGNRKRRKASDYISPGYEFQGMAITYHPEAAVVIPRRSTRPSNPTQPAKEVATQRSARRVQFSTPVVDVPPTGGVLLTTGNPDPLTTPAPQPTPQDVPGVPHKYAYKERLPVPSD